MRLPGERLGKDKVSSFGFASVYNVFISYFGHQFTYTYNIQGYDRATTTHYMLFYRQGKGPVKTGQCQG